jgi:hypothetical protein
MATTADEKLELAGRHLERVLAAWDEPTDWDDLSLYGFYCLEAAVEAAAIHLGLSTSRSLPSSHQRAKHRVRLCST